VVLDDFVVDGVLLDRGGVSRCLAVHRNYDISQWILPREYLLESLCVAYQEAVRSGHYRYCWFGWWLFDFL